MTAESQTDNVATTDLSYGDALEELEQLLDDLEGADTDVDLLAQRVARGVELVRFCRARLEVVAEDVDAVVAELISVDSADDGTAADRGATQDAPAAGASEDSTQEDDSAEDDR